MSDHVRFFALAAALFVTSYTGVAWVMAGTPLPGMPPQEPQARLAALPAHAPGDVTSSLPLSSAPVIPPAPAQPAALPLGDGHPQRDKLRLAALEASTAYALALCDEAAKAIMIRAVSAYAKAWADMMGCGPDGCDYRKINVTAATFSTPLDISARDAIGAAFEKRGISLDDFPSSLRINVAMLVRGRSAPATACPQPGAQVIGR
jgi:hypothetical protein